MAIWLGCSDQAPTQPSRNGGAELVLAPHRVADVAERPVVRVDPGGGAGVDHPGDRVVPEVLLHGRPRRIGIAGGGVGADDVPGVAAADARRLHPAGGGEVGRAEGQSLHPGGCRADLLDVRDAARGLEDRVDEDRPGQTGLGLQLGEQPVDVVDVLGALDLGDHDDVELRADRPARSS